MWAMLSQCLVYPQCKKIALNGEVVFSGMAVLCSVWFLCSGLERGGEENENILFH